MSQGVFRKHKKIFWRNIKSVRFEKSAFFISDGKEEIEVVPLLSEFGIFLSVLEESVPQDLYNDSLQKYKQFLKK